MGNSAVGKTSLIETFTCGATSFNENYRMTTNVALTLNQTQIPGSDVTVEQFLYDIPGNDLFHQQPQLTCCESADFIVCVFDVSKRDSFKACVQWIKRATTSNAHVPVVLVANKIDFSSRPSEADNFDGLIEVDHEEALQLARKSGYEYFECSALGNKDINLPFHYMASKASEKFNRAIRSGSVKS